jgi:hypothetical protein
MYDYPTWSGLGVMAGERRVPQDPNLNVQLPIAPLTTPVTTSSASTSTPPAASQVVTGTPGASPLASTQASQIAAVQATCPSGSLAEVVAFLGAGAAALIFLPGAMKLLAAVPLYFAATTPFSGYTAMADADGNITCVANPSIGL